MRRYLDFMKSNQKTFIITLSVLLLANLTLLILNGTLLGKRVNEQIDFPQKYQIVSPPLPEELYFAGERVPLEIPDVRERIDRELIVNTYLHSATILNIKRANRWLPVITDVLNRNGIPEDFKYIAIIESGLENVISSKKATGFWQFTEDAALQFGLEVNEQVDERYHSEKSTQAACNYLKKAYAKFNNWTMAAASYNMGMAGLDRQVRRQRVNNYYEILLNDETSRYIFRALALKLIMTDPEKYGYSIKKEEMYDPYKTYDLVVDSSITNLTTFAFSKGTNYKILKILNPWLRDTTLTNAGKRQYLIKLPHK